MFYEFVLFATRFYLKICLLILGFREAHNISVIKEKGDESEINWYNVQIKEDKSSRMRMLAAVTGNVINARTHGSVKVSRRHIMQIYSGNYLIYLGVAEIVFILV